MRKKIHLSLDVNTINKIEFICSNLLIPKGVLLDSLMDYALKKRILTKHNNHDRKKLTTTVNPIIWNNFTQYADSYKLKYNALLEEAMKRSYRNYLRKINSAYSK